MTAGGGGMVGGGVVGGGMIGGGLAGMVRLSFDKLRMIGGAISSGWLGADCRG